MVMFRERKIELFEKLRKDNLERYERDQKRNSFKNSLEAVFNNYSNSSHFIKELIQNADDAKAKYIKFYVQKDGLYVIHNGSPFTISDITTDHGDINSITGISNSTKEKNTIGKFGIGFKSVFKITSKVHVFENDIKWCIENFYVPNFSTLLAKYRKKNETEFYFPFIKNNNDKINTNQVLQKDAYNLIKDELNQLKIPTMFLNNVKKIIWKCENEEGEYETTRKLLRSSAGKNLYSVVSKSANENEYFLLINQKINDLNLYNSICIQTNKPRNRVIKNNVSDSTFVFFKTKESNKLPFIINSPFIVTPGRENLQEKDDNNVIRIKELKKLFVGSLQLIKSWSPKIINDYLYEILPNTSNHERYQFYFPIQDHFVEKIQDDSLKILPTRKGKLIKSSEAYCSSDNELIKLFDDEKLSEILGKKAYFIFSSLDDVDYDYVQELTSIKKEIKIIDLFERDQSQFIKNQDKKWLIKLYKYLFIQRENYNNFGDRDCIRQIIDNSKIFLDNSMPPRAMSKLVDDEVNLYLSSTDFSSKNILNAELEKINKNIFKQLGFKKPDLKDDIINNILPKYKLKNTPSIKEHLEHIKLVSQYLSNNTISNDLKSKITQNPFFLVESKSKKFSSIDELYFPSKELKIYFTGIDDVNFMKLNYYHDFVEEEINVLIDKLEIHKKPRIISKEFNGIQDRSSFDKYLKNYSIEREQSYYNDILIISKLDKLEENFKNMSLSRSINLWNLLSKFIDSNKKYNENLYGFGSTEYKYFFRKWKYKSGISDSLKKLKEIDWLYDKNEERKTISNITIQTLHQDYKADEKKYKTLVEVLGVISFEEDKQLRELEQKTGKKYVVEDEYHKQMLNDMGINEEEYQRRCKEEKNREKAHIEPVFIEKDQPKILIIQPKTNRKKNTRNKSNSPSLNTNQTGNESKKKPERQLNDIDIKRLGREGEKHVINILRIEYPNAEIEDCNSIEEQEGYDIKLKQSGSLEFIEVKVTNDNKVKITDAQWQKAKKSQSKYTIYIARYSKNENEYTWGDISKLENPYQMWKDGEIKARPLEITFKYN